jgi:hypothetical protein
MLVAVIELKLGVPGAVGGEVSAVVVNEPLPLAALVLPAASRARTASV